MAGLTAKEIARRERLGKMNEEMAITVSVGDRFGKLVVIKRVDNRAPRGGAPRRHFLCHCDCGNDVLVSTFNLRSGKQIACGCMRGKYDHADRCTHGFTSNFRRNDGSLERLTYIRWASMRARCSPNAADKYRRTWWNRGIRICDRWARFENFFSDMGFCPSANHTLDRTDCNGHYEPQNCQWATKAENSRLNKRKCWCPHCEYHQRLHAVIPIVQRPPTPTPVNPPAR